MDNQIAITRREFMSRASNVILSEEGTISKLSVDAPGTLKLMFPMLAITIVMDIAQELFKEEEKEEEAFARRDVTAGLKEN